jgi:radical SAM protein with 4Fe4S-binding SPASM domain
MDEFEAWAATIPWMDKPPQYAMFLDLRNRRDNSEKNRQIESLRATPEEGLRVLNRHALGYRREMAVFCQKFMAPPGDRLFNCGAGHGGCVDAYGGFRPCIGFCAPEWTYNLLRGNLRGALEKFFRRMGEVQATNPDYLARCARCFLKGLCEQCPAKSWSESGALDTPVEYFCQVAHAQARELGLIGIAEKAWTVVDSAARVERLTTEGRPGTDKISKGRFSDGKE